MKYLKYLPYAVLIVSVIAYALIAWLQSVQRQSALAGWRTSRSVVNRTSEFEFVTHGIREGMSFDEVRQRMAGCSSYSGLLDTGGSAAEPYIAYFDFQFRSDRNLPRRNKVWVYEHYTVVFDVDKKVMALKYFVADAGLGTQLIEVNFRKKSLSEPLQFYWRIAD